MCSFHDSCARGDRQGCFHMCKAVLPHMKKTGPQDGAVIVNITAFLQDIATPFQARHSLPRAAGGGNKDEAILALRRTHRTLQMPYKQQVNNPYKKWVHHHTLSSAPPTRD